MLKKSEAEAISVAKEADPLASIEQYRKGRHSVYSKDYLGKWDIREYMFREEGFPAGEAMATRNRAARLLRSLGWKTDSKTWDFGGLGYGRAFTVRGEKLRVPEEK